MQGFHVPIDLASFMGFAAADGPPGGTAVAGNGRVHDEWLNPGVMANDSYDPMGPPHAGEPSCRQMEGWVEAKATLTFKQPANIVAKELEKLTGAQQKVADLLKRFNITIDKEFIGYNYAQEKLYCYDGEHLVPIEQKSAADGVVSNWRFYNTSGNSPHRSRAQAG